MASFSCKLYLIFRYKEKGDLEALFFAIQTKEKAMRMKIFVPNQGLLLHDVETAWKALDSAEHARQSILNEELARCVENCFWKF